MSWLDTHRSEEPAGESTLREELRALLGMGTRNYFESEPTPELVALAEDLRREAKRRNHTARKRSHWMLMAAALPLALAFGGVSLWGIAQKHKAEDLAAAISGKEAEITRMATTLKKMEVLAPNAAPTSAQPLLAADHKRSKPVKGRELVEPVEHPAGQILQDVQQVKSH
jgi:hypothetical protein